VVLVALVLVLSTVPGRVTSAGEVTDVERLVAQGIQALNAGDPRTALPRLLRAMELSPDNSEATYWAGVAAAQMDQAGQAEELFERTLALDPDAVDAGLALIRFYVATGRCDRAQAVYRDSIEPTQDSTVCSHAATLMQRCRAPAAEGPLHLSVTLGVQHDSNVLLEPSNPPQPADHKSDDRAVINVAADARLWRTQHMVLKGKYGIYQSLHDDISDFNVHQQKAGLDLDVLRSKSWRPGVGYLFKYAFFGGDKYSRLHVLYGKLRLIETDHLSTELRYEYTYHNYFDTDQFLTNGLRTGSMHAAGVTQRFSSRRGSANVYYFNEWNQTEVDYWDYHGYRVGAKGVFGISPAIYLSANGEFRKNEYQGVFPDSTKRRVDENQAYSIGAHYRFSKKLKISFTETYVENQSNLPLFDYHRNIVGLYLTAGLL
jgi:hypothetical protein